MPFNILTPEEAAILEFKATEAPFTGEYNDFYKDGFYSCKKCNKPLYRSLDKFNSGCGWPSFDDEIPNRVKHQLDNDKIRTEITCVNCDAHLGHVFSGEQLTNKNIRHCVNSLSLKFNSIEYILSLLPNNDLEVDAIIIAGGCFWGIEYYFEQEYGVLATSPGYTGGNIDNPSYKIVCKGDSGHAEAVVVVFEPLKTDVETLYKLFFDIHNPTQKNRQGPDIGSQYRSAIFTLSDRQADIAKALITKYPGACTEITKFDYFWMAEEKHHHYYSKYKQKPYCHVKK